MKMDTPRTEAEWVYQSSFAYPAKTQIVKADFARTLERELADALNHEYAKELKAAEQEIARLKTEAAALRRKLDALFLERGRLQAMVTEMQAALQWAAELLAVKPIL